MKPEKAALLTVLCISLLSWLYAIGIQYAMIQANQMGQLSMPVGHWWILNTIRMDDFAAVNFIIFIAALFLWFWRYSGEEKALMDEKGQ